MAQLLPGWYEIGITSTSGKAGGSTDKYFLNPAGKQFRSIRQIQRWVNAESASAALQGDGSSVQLQVGDRVSARFKGSVEYYPGTIKKVNTGGTLHVLFDDGDVDLTVAKANVQCDRESAQTAQGPALQHQHPQRGR